jgi:hypothetical protein
MAGLAEVAAELVLFAVATSLMFWHGDLKRLLQPNTHNTYLIIAAATVLVPMLELGRGLEASLPLLLVPSSVFWLILFIYSIVNNLRLKGEKGRRVSNG